MRSKIDNYGCRQKKGGIMNKKYLAELFGTLFLVLMGCGSAVFAGSAVGNLGVSFAFGLTVLIMVYSIGPVSGCHINPAVTLAMVVSRGMDKKEAAFYMIYQVVGGIIGAFIVYLIASNFFSLSVSSVGANAYSYTGAAIIAEIIFTALFIFVILGSTDSKANTKFAGISIGLALVLIHIVSIPLTGTSVNPARSIGPAIFSGTKALSQLWVFIAAPLTGALLGSYLWKIISPAEKK
ncbi:MAG: MIP family channel protein [Endomicrobium sp.]|jgi:aquaporin Z|nr:MIP family channel protein [Endomicrobium sp.]